MRAKALAAEGRDILSFTLVTWTLYDSKKYSRSGSRFHRGMAASAFIRSKYLDFQN